MSLLSFISSKGGSGKTTLNCILAIYLFDKTGSVCLIDIDSQKSAVQQRKIDLYIYDQEQSSYLKKVLKNIKKHKKPYYDIISADYTNYKDLSSTIASAKKKYKYVILDFPGSLTTNENIKYLLTELDYMFIPTYVANNDFYSAIEFSKNIELLKKSNQIKADYYLFFNRYSDHKNIDLWKSRIKTIINNKVPFIDNFLYEGVCIEKYSTIIKPTQGSDKHYKAQKMFFNRIIKIISHGQENR